MAMGGLLGVCVLLGLHHALGTSIKDPECKSEGHFMLHPTNRCKYLHCILSLQSGRQNHLKAVTQDCPLGTGVPKRLYEKGAYSSRSTLCTDNVPYGTLEACRVLDLPKLPEGKSWRPGRDYRNEYQSAEYDDNISLEREDYEEPYYSKRTGRQRDARNRDTSQESPHKWYNILVESRLQEDLQSHEESHESYLHAEERHPDTWRDKHEAERYVSKRRHKGSHYRRKKPQGKSWDHGSKRRDGGYGARTNRGYESRRIYDPQFSSPPKPHLPKMKFQYKSKSRKRHSKSPHFSRYSNTMKRGSYSDSKYGKSDFDKDYYSSRKSAKKDFDDSFYRSPSDPYPVNKEFDTDFYSGVASANEGSSTDYFSSPSFRNKDSRSSFGARKVPDTDFFSSPSFSSKDSRSGFGSSKGSRSDFFSSPSFSSKDDMSGFGSSKSAGPNFFSSPSFSKKDIGSGFGPSKDSSTDVFSSPSFSNKDTTSDFLSSNSPSGNPFSDTFDKNKFYKDFKYDFPYGKLGSNMDKDNFPYNYDYKYPYDSDPFSKQVKSSQKVDTGSQSKRRMISKKNDNTKMLTKNSRDNHATPYPWDTLGYVVVHTTPSPTQHIKNNQAQQGHSNAYKPDENTGRRLNMNLNLEPQRNAQSASNVQPASNVLPASNMQPASNVQTVSNVQSPSNVQPASNVQSALSPGQRHLHKHGWQITQQGTANSVPPSTGNGNQDNFKSQKNPDQGQSTGKERQGSSQRSLNQARSPSGDGGQYHPLRQNVPGRKQANQGDSVDPSVNNPMLPYTYTPSYLVDWYSKVTGINKKGESSASPKNSRREGERNGEWRKKPSTSGNAQQNQGYSQPMPRDWPSNFARYDKLGMGTKTIGQIGIESTSTGYQGKAQVDNKRNAFGKNGFDVKYQGFGRSSPRYGRGGPLRGGKQITPGEAKSNIKEPLFGELKPSPNLNDDKLPPGHDIIGKSVKVDSEGIKIRYHGASMLPSDRRQGYETEDNLESPVLQRPPQENEFQESDKGLFPSNLEEGAVEEENTSPSYPPTSSMPRLPRDIVADIVDRAYDQKSRPSLKFDSEIADTEQVEPNFFFSGS